MLPEAGGRHGNCPQVAESGELPQAVAAMLVAGGWGEMASSNQWSVTTHRHCWQHQQQPVAKKSVTACRRRWQRQQQPIAGGAHVPACIPYTLPMNYSLFNKHPYYDFETWDAQHRDAVGLLIRMAPKPCYLKTPHLPPEHVYRCSLIIYFQAFPVFSIYSSRRIIEFKA